MLPGMLVGFLEQDPEKKKQFFQSFFTEKLAPHLLLVEKRLEANGGVYLVGSDVSSPLFSIQ